MKLKEFIQNYTCTYHFECKILNGKTFMYDTADANGTGCDEMEIYNIECRNEITTHRTAQTTEIRPILVIYLK